MPMFAKARNEPATILPTLIKNLSEIPNSASSLRKKRNNSPTSRMKTSPLENPSRRCPTGQDSKAQGAALGDLIATVTLALKGRNSAPGFAPSGLGDCSVNRSQGFALGYRVSTLRAGKHATDLTESTARVNRSSHVSRRCPGDSGVRRTAARTRRWRSGRAQLP